MIRIEITRYERSMTISVNGHAGYAKHGQDIVCSAVSVITEMIRRYLETSHSISFKHIEMIPGKAYMEAIACQCNVKEFDEAMNAMIGGYRMVAEAYPKHVSFEDESGEKPK